MREHRPSGFTLIEILLVISIIAILSALLFPVFQTAKRASKGTVCLENLHSLGIAIDLYSTDADQYYPFGTDGHSKSAPAGQDQEEDSEIRSLPLVNVLLASYASSPNLWMCPLDNGRIGRAEPIGSSIFTQFGSSYWFQPSLAIYHVASPAEGTSWGTGTPSFGPAQIVILHDWSPFWHSNDSALVPGNERYNALYADDHAKSIDGAAQTIGTSVSFD